MELYKITYKDLARNKEIKEYFDNKESCNIRKEFLRSYPKGCFGTITTETLSDFYAVNYSKLGTDKVPDKWAFGEVIRYKEVGKWYEEYPEFCETLKDAFAIVEDKKKITNRAYGKFSIHEYKNGEQVSIVYKEE